MPAMGSGGVLLRCRQRRGPIAGMARSYTRGKKDVFHANFHDAYRHTPNDEKSAGFRRGGFQTRPGRFRDASGAFPPQCRFETCPYTTALRPYVGEVFHAKFMASEATPDDETAPMFVYERAMPAMGGEGVLMRCWQRSGPIAGMARSYTGEKVYFTPTVMMRIATHRMMKNPQGFVGAGFKPAQGVSGTHQEHFRRRAGLKPVPTKPRFVLTSEMFFTLTAQAHGRRSPSFKTRHSRSPNV